MRPAHHSSATQPRPLKRHGALWHVSVTGISTALLIFGLVPAPQLVPPASATRLYGEVTILLAPTADSYVNSSKTKTNYGASSSLKAQSGSATLTSYLRFSLADVTGAITHATLEMYAGGNSHKGSSWPDGYEVAGVSDTTWSESTINYSNAPPPTPPVGSSGPVASNSWSSVDVTSLVSGSPGLDLAVITSSTSALTLNSREARSNSPQLALSVLDATAPTSPDGLTATTLGDTEVDLSWLPSTDDVGVTGYTIYRDGQVLNSVDGATTGYVDTTVAAPATYIYVIDAVDGAGNRSAPSDPVEVTVSPGPAGLQVFAYYYLWWSDQHWHDKLGSDFPYEGVPLPLPATVGSDGCGAASLYNGNYLTDTPPALWSQDDPGLIEADVRMAGAAGITGFLVNWNGTGALDQSIASSSYNQRLDSLVQAVNEVNAEGIPFKLWISYKASAVILSLDQIRNDWSYIVRQYGTNPAFDRRYSSKIVMVWTGSRKYDLPTIQAISSEYRSSFFIVGDENWNTWPDGRGAYLDGDTYYWSTQNPITNPSSFQQLQDLASMVRGSGLNPDGSTKSWFAPLAPGYNNELSGGTCVPRNGGQTMLDLFTGNSASDPDGWAIISWNEITEGSYIVPLQRYGSFYLDTLTSLITT